VSNVTRITWRVVIVKFAHRGQLVASRRSTVNAFIICLSYIACICRIIHTHTHILTHTHTQAPDVWGVCVCVWERERVSEWVRERESGRLRGVMCSVFVSSRSTVIPLHLSFRCTYEYTRRKVWLYPFLISIYIDLIYWVDIDMVLVSLMSRVRFLVPKCCFISGLRLQWSPGIFLFSSSKHGVINIHISAVTIDCHIFHYPFTKRIHEASSKHSVINIHISVLTIDCHICHYPFTK
jgi:hypothetical protein